MYGPDSPADPGAKSALRVVPGVASPAASPRRPRRRPQTWDPAELAEEVLAGDRVRLARAITLVESDAPAHAEAAADLVGRILPHSGGAIRIGITGVPGVGKSTFIERFGLYLCEAGHRVAVLAVDPSSSVSGGSVLGDKTRMEELSRHPRAFIRPSPASGTLGGVARKTLESLLLCEAAGFDVLLVETVGVGQSETAVRAMVDFFLLLLLPGAGDELQGIKKGIVEMADSLLVTKADGDNKVRAELSATEYRRAIHHLHSPTPGWTPGVHLCSAMEGAGIRELWDEIARFKKTTTASGAFESRRSEQTRAWFRSLVEEGLRAWFRDRPGMASALKQAETDAVAGKAGIAVLVREILARLPQA